MPTIDWPEALIPQTAQLTLRKAGAQFASPFNGTLQAVDFVGERWTLSASLAQMSARNPRGVGAFCNRLAGGVERVRVWPFHTGGVPRGSMRGAPVLSATATRGQTALGISRARSGANLLAGGGFEVNGGAGLGAEWSAYSAGSNGLVSYWLDSNQTQHGAFAQVISASGLSGTQFDRAGMVCFVDGIKELSTYSLSFSVNSSSSCWVRARIDWSVGLTYLSTSTESWPLPTFGWQRQQLVAQAPSAASSLILYIWLEQATSPPAAIQATFDEVQFEQASTASPFAGRPTVLAGDFLAAGGQLFQVAADTTLSDAGTGSVPIVNRVRSTIAAGSAVTWYRPTCEMVLPAMQAGPVHRPGVIESTALDLVEVW